MGKRKRNSSKSHIKKKLRKLEKYLRRYESSDSSDDGSAHDGYRDRNPPFSDCDMEMIDSDASNRSPSYNIRSAVHVVDVHHDASTVPPPDCVPSEATILPQAMSPFVSNADPTPSSSQPIGDNPNPAPISLPVDILDVLGESKEKQETFGPKIQDEISERWGRILCEGLNKEQKKVLGEKICVPENFRLVKAPKLNPEIASVLVESTRNRDKRLEAAQNYLGLGISGLTNLTSSLIEKDMDKMDIIKRLSETNQILLDLHFENTVNRRKLITYSLDKKFQDIVQDVKRDSLLFGENLTDKIKASQSAERSGFQIKKTNTSEASASKKHPNRQGNWRGPPRQAQRGNRQGGTRNQPAYRSNWRRSAPTSSQFQDRTKDRLKPQPQTKPR